MNILAIGCHPDDLEIGCGGTLARYAAEGSRVTLCVVANGNMGHVIIQPEELRRARQQMQAVGRPMDTWVTLYTHEINPARKIASPCSICPKPN